MKKKIKKKKVEFSDLPAHPLIPVFISQKDWKK